MKKEMVQIVLNGQNFAIMDMYGSFIKIFLVSINAQKEIATYLKDNNFKISKKSAKNFPYLEMFVD